MDRHIVIQCRRAARQGHVFRRRRADGVRVVELARRVLWMLYAVEPARPIQIDKLTDPARREHPFDALASVHVSIGTADAAHQDDLRADRRDDLGRRDAQKHHVVMLGRRGLGHVPRQGRLVPEKEVLARRINARQRAARVAPGAGDDHRRSQTASSLVDPPPHGKSILGFAASCECRVIAEQRPLDARRRAAMLNIAAWRKGSMHFCNVMIICNLPCRTFATCALRSVMVAQVDLCGIRAREAGDELAVCGARRGSRVVSKLAPAAHPLKRRRSAPKCKSPRRVGNSRNCFAQRGLGAGSDKCEARTTRRVRRAAAAGSPLPIVVSGDCRRCP